MFSPKLAAAALTAAVFASPALALEYPIGTPQQKEGMEIVAVYLQPIEMEPEGMMAKAAESDIHIEADIHALASNVNGFEEGAWIPYLTIKYEITKVDAEFKITGEFMPMVANDGPHYGDNLKLAGPGKYRVKYTILPPSETPHVHFGRHTDRATGVRPWFKPFTVDYEFTYVGIGKKGGY
ncbi:membrane protein [Betaproteobacteria bacterium]|nr:membrane protein [Betaproteobacteria bacterium]GHU00534.1 membrane protein [Betaproteobacteria bacterium]GHU00908.1 membrane protein [Betaproteobacteria bacterium]GHU10776.1 membrane protein [Betaproteobacteria bacterium]GHU19846.1 membrane protein [Betaproteobacteria bacterium]